MSSGSAAGKDASSHTAPMVVFGGILVIAVASVFAVLYTYFTTDDVGELQEMEPAHEKVPGVYQGPGDDSPRLTPRNPE